MIGALLLGAALAAAPTQLPHFDHIFVIVEENKGYATVLDRGAAPNIAGLAHTYGVATQMYAERHPSEPNYVALLGGDTFGIADDDAWYCVPGSTDASCKGSTAAGFVPHLVQADNLGSQLRAAGLTWRAYLQDIPAPGSLAIFSPETATAPAALYAAKHTGFTNFANIHHDPDLAQELVGFDALQRDLDADTMPAFALIVPNQCNEMHGISGPKSPQDCQKDDLGLVARGDAYTGKLVAQIMHSAAWTKPGVRTAIVITWDEDGKADRVPGAAISCCVAADASNPGGGHIPTIVGVNDGPRGISDPTPYDHYSLLRTIEDAFGLAHLRHAADAGIRAMLPLFAGHPEGS